MKLGDKADYCRWSAELEDSPQRSLLGFTSRQLAEGMPLAMLAHRIGGEILFANDGLARLLGYERTADLFEQSSRSIRDFMHPDDWERVRAALPGATAASAHGTERDLGFRVVTRGGAVRHVVYRARLVQTTNRGDVLYAYIVDEHTLERALAAESAIPQA